MENLIKQLQNNEKFFCKMTTEMQAKAVVLGKNGNFQFLDIARSFLSAKWIDIDRESENREFSPYGIYRLRPEWKEEAGMVKFEIKPTSKGNLSYYKSNGCMIGFITRAVLDPDFIGFLYEDDSVHPFARKYKYKDGTRGNLATVYTLESGVTKVLTPTHVLFRKGK
jgi:hypothetical protein